MRFGLDRMRRMMTALGSPERRIRLRPRPRHERQVLDHADDRRDPRASRLRTGAYLSPHLVSYRERVLVDGRELDPDAFAAAVARAAWAAERVNRTLAEDDHVTQFELLTAAALWEMARQEVEVAVVEAGLGGRYDATSVIDSQVTVLTNVGLEHTRWLGPTVTDIAEEKLAVVRPRATLVLGEPTWRRRRWPWPSGWRVSAGRGSCARAAAPAATRAAGPGRVPAPQLRARARRRRGVPAGGRHPAARAGGGAGRPPRPRCPGACSWWTRTRRRSSTARTTPTRSPRWCESLPDVLARGAARAGAGRARGQGRRRHARGAAARVRAGMVHRSPEQPRAAAGGAAVARAAARLRRDRMRADRARRRGAAEHGAARWALQGAGRRRAQGRAGDRIGLPRRRPARLARAAPLPWRCRGQVPAELRQMNDEGPSVLTMIGAVALIVALVDPRILRRGLRIRPAVSLNSAGRCSPSHISESKAAA